MNRTEELTANWHSVQSSVASACDSAGRDPNDITIVAVTKTWPATDVDILATIGVTDVGENRDQEASGKKLQVTSENLRWHAIGQIQTNKVKSIVRWADVAHSIDRVELVTAFAKHLEQLDTTMDVFVQVNLDEQPAEGRGGALPTDTMTLIESVLQTPQLQLLGVMGVAPLGGDVAKAFARLQEFSAKVISHAPEANKISAGMSDDYKIALKFGATHLRLGSLILGHRTYSG